MDVYFFAPHQDDELTNLGPELCRALSRGETARVVLCTDGGASGVKGLLQNGGCCAWHAGKHTYRLSPAAFSAARDKEFTESCLALGVPAENILISPLRGPDGRLTRDSAISILRAAIAGKAPENVRIVTLAPEYEHRQNPDHTAVGEAAKTLYENGECGRITLVHEFILPLPEGEAPVPGPLTPAQCEKIEKAAAAYRRWAPAEGRYAVGYHSVADEFNDFLQEIRKYAAER